MEISGIRRSYERAALKREDLPEDPYVLFESWLQTAVDEQLSDPTGMVVATVDSEGRPSLRSVLLKKFDHDGFVFFMVLPGTSGSYPGCCIQNQHCGSYKIFSVPS